MKDLQRGKAALSGLAQVELLNCIPAEPPINGAVFPSFIPMRLRIFGFGFDKSKAPSSIPVSDVFASLGNRPTLLVENEIRIAVTKIPVIPPQVLQPTLGSNAVNWWLGVVLKVKDAKSFTKLTSRGGKRIMTAEALPIGEDLAEANVFIAHPKTGSGLYAHHGGSASLTYDFGKLIGSELRHLQGLERARIDGDDETTTKEKRKLRSACHGYYWIINLVLEQEFKKLVASMKKVDSVKVRLGTLKTAEKIFGGYKWTPEYETVEYKLPIQAISAEVGDGLEVALNQKKIDSATVTGLDQNGKDRTFHHVDNPHILDQFDYDEVMGNFILDFQNYSASLTASRIGKELEKLLGRPDIWNLLSRT
jgi:hypothetical protein